MTETCTPLTEIRHSLSWRSSTSLTSTHMLLFVGACQAPASVPRPGRHGRTLLANCRHSGQVNSPLSTEKPWRTWSFWGEKGMKGAKIVRNNDHTEELLTQKKIWLIPTGKQVNFKAQPFSYPQRLHIWLLTIYMQSVSTGLDVDTPIPTYWHRLQTRAL